MTDPEIARLFSAGTAPARDAAFARRVKLRISMARLGLPFSLALRAAGIVAGACAVHFTLRAIEPVLPRLGADLPQFMGVPVPVVLLVLLLALAARTMRRLGMHLHTPRRYN